jgi:N-acyl-D-amino-acid deacylase
LHAKFDIVIKGGRVVTGLGNPWFNADIGIKDGRIAEVGKLTSNKSRETIPADDLIVCPGFIDMHSHSDLMLFANPKNEAKVMQGITTELLGQDGISVAPVKKNDVDQLRKYVSGLLGEPSMDWNWSTVGEYLDELETHKIATNAAFLIPQGTLRMYIMGNADRDPTLEELQKMKRAIADSMTAGAFGLSTGLIYAPCAYTKTPEFVELCKVVAEHEGIFVSHIRDQGDRIIESIAEMIEVGTKSTVPIHISHLKVAGRRNWNKTSKVLELLDAARSKGVDITADQYPYTRGSTFLQVVIPSWAHEGGVDRLLERLRDPALRERIRKEIQNGLPGWENMVELAGGWEGITVSSVKSEANKKFEGKNVAEIASITKKNPEDAVFDLLLEEHAGVTAVMARTSEDSVRTIWKHPSLMMGTDSIFLGKPHPRTYGTSPRILGRVSREEKVMPIEQAIRKMTSFPAQRLGLVDRGFIIPKAWADIVVFDADSVVDLATYERPRQYPKGIEFVLVNGVTVIRDGRHTGALPGRTLRKRH